jgi:hypothetical protein
MAIVKEDTAEKPRAKRNRPLLSLYAFVFVATLGLITGMLLQHYLVEPLLSSSKTDEMQTLKVKYALAEKSLRDCINDLDDVNQKLNACRTGSRV